MLRLPKAQHSFKTQMGYRSQSWIELELNVPLTVETRPRDSLAEGAAESAKDILQDLSRGRKLDFSAPLWQRCGPWQPMSWWWTGSSRRAHRLQDARSTRSGDTSSWSTSRRILAARARRSPRRTPFWPGCQPAASCWSRVGPVISGFGSTRSTSAWKPSATAATRRCSSGSTWCSASAVQPRRRHWSSWSTTRAIDRSIRRSRSRPASRWRWRWRSPTHRSAGLRRPYIEV